VFSRRAIPLSYGALKNDSFHNLRAASFKRVVGSVDSWSTRARLRRLTKLPTDQRARTESRSPAEDPNRDSGAEPRTGIGHTPKPYCAKDPHGHGSDNAPLEPVRAGNRGRTIG
jgi:hypothetical protein